MNCFIPPKDTKQINLLAGLAGPKSPLKNLPDFWLENTKLLQKGDILFLAGDFVEYLGSDMCFPTTPKPGNDIRKTTVTDAAKWNVNNDYSRACTTQSELDSCKFGNFSNGINTKYEAAECICPCIETKYSSKYPLTSKSAVLMDELIKAMQRGAKIVILDDYLFIRYVYTDDKAVHDASFITLQNASNNLKTDVPGGGLYVFQFGADYANKNKANTGISIHSKICAFYFIGERADQDPWMSCTLGSYNPSFPTSLTFETATAVTGLLSNPFINATAHLFFDVLTNVINDTYSPDPSNPSIDTYYKGKVWDPSKGSGYNQGGCNNYRDGDDSPLHCTIPPSAAGDQYGFVQPWVDIANALKIDYKKPASWWLTMSGTNIDLWKNKSFPMYGETLFCSDVVKTDINFCGVQFCNKSITDNKYHDLDEQRITFTEKDVEIKLGAEPTALFPRFYYGLSLVNEIYSESRKYVKVGIMKDTFNHTTNNFYGNMNNTVMSDSWMTGPGYTLYPNPNSTAQQTTGQFMNFAQRGLPYYVLQALESGLKQKCAYMCDNGVCKPESLYDKKYLWNSTCYNKDGSPKNDGITCSSKEGCPNLSCKTKQNDIKENYSYYCTLADNSDFIKTYSNGYLDGWDKTGGTFTGAIPALLKGFNSINTYDANGNKIPIPRSQFLSGSPDAKSTLEDGTLKTVSENNPYPFFYKAYISGIHWKFYMNEQSVLFSTQHLDPVFYNYYDYSSMGYDIKYSNCPRIIDYYDQLYNYIWQYQSFDVPIYSQNYSVNDGICYKIANPSNSSKSVSNKCADEYGFSTQKLLPPICRSDNCCEIEGAVMLNGSCYPGGKYKKTTPPNPPNPPKPDNDNKKSLSLTYKILLGIMFVAVIVLLLFILYKYVFKTSGRRRRHKR